jgi:indole-3-glycerol-phosphate lyase
VLAMLKEVTPELSCPVVLFSYFKPVVRWGLADFAAAAKEAGVHGLIVPDLPYAATCALRSEAMKNNLELVGPFAIHRFFIPIPSCHRDAETETKEAFVV